MAAFLRSFDLATLRQVIGSMCDMPPPLLRTSQLVIVSTAVIMRSTEGSAPW